MEEEIDDNNVLFLLFIHLFSDNFHCWSLLEVTRMEPYLPITANMLCLLTGVTGSSSGTDLKPTLSLLGNNLELTWNKPCVNLKY